MMNRSTSGVYMSVSNIRNKYKYSRRHMYTLMLLPPHVSLREALQPLRRDLNLLEAGVKMEMFQGDGKEAKVVTVHGAISMLIGDHVQACANCCHLGNNANKNCRMCMTDKADRMHCSPTILEHSMTRCISQSRAIINQMNFQIGRGASASRIKQVYGFYGIYPSPLPFDDLVDPYRQSFPCVGHCLDLGLLGKLITFMLTNLSSAHTNIFQCRVKCIEYPRGWTRLPPFVSKLKGKLTEPMKVMRKLGMHAYQLFCGIAPTDVLDLTLDLVHLRNMILAEGHDQDTIADVSYEYHHH